MNESSQYPMHCIGTDLFEYNNKPYLIMVDYFSSYPWIHPLRNISSLSVIEAMKSVFSEFGYPDTIHSDWDTLGVFEERSISSSFSLLDSD